MPDYEPDDLRTLAFQSATGSGKTLLMHAHILQYRHYLRRAGGRLNNVVLVTPNEQMSAQHERELRESGLAARLFIREGRFDDLKYWYDNLKISVIQVRAYAYQPLLHVRKDRVVTVQPVPLDTNERRVVDGLASLADRCDSCLQGRELFLIRNLTRGRGASFFDDFGYYPDFIVWLNEGDLQHILFLDPKGLSRFGGKECRKVRLHHEIAEVEDRVRTGDPNLHLRVYVLSVTPAARIDDGGRSASDEEGRRLLPERPRIA